ncbi:MULTISPECIES: divalent-cation tolerance protein CutA [unclassified Sphingobium]|uniref:divalent-cation tolerance protein CutA n=1 Tax=unclassified Sphingobium TaxID=2611147 RepID=UPI002225837B|nr:MULTISPECIES: divalent-cation tolerance protein CutA [unclassified Sphingobium]MCW2348748.1 periplasmic divalent cation tolerance protein [Sphingobium sp. B12D2B]MCW2367875.1 periplasmic divalent cation tolerance protein [Sphingobium sp. B11D3D]
MSEIALVYVPYGSRAEAEAAGRQMVQERLAACANVLGEGCSIYPWDGVIEQSAETVVLFKTAPDRCAALMTAIAQAHAYDLPAILTWPAHTTAAYAAWVHEKTRPDARLD